MRKDDGELLASVARHEIHVLPRLRVEQACQVAQCIVAGAMSELVVEELEVIDVEHQQ